MTCPLCDGTGYKDYAGFAMDPCDHEKGPAIQPALNRSAAFGRRAMYVVRSEANTMTQQAEQAMTPPPGAKWQPIETAPKDGTAFQAVIPGHGADNVICWTDGLLDDHGENCGSWVFASEQEPPECWTDGYCWAVNEDGIPSVLPTHWMPLPALP